MSTSSCKAVSISPERPPEPTLSSSGDYANSMRKEVTAHGGLEGDELQVFQAWLWNAQACRARIGGVAPGVSGNGAGEDSHPGA